MVLLRILLHFFTLLGDLRFMVLLCYPAFDTANVAAVCPDPHVEQVITRMHACVHSNLILHARIRSRSLSLMQTHGYICSAKNDTIIFQHWSFGQ